MVASTLKIGLIVFGTIGVGIGATTLLNQPDSMSSPSSQLTQYAASTSASRTVQQIGPRESTYFEENCVGRCRCSVYAVTETTAKPGIVTASRDFANYPTRHAICPASGGARQGLPVPHQKGQCYICPSGMQLSTLLRRGPQIENRWGLNPVCVVSTRQCKAETAKKFDGIK